MTTEPTPNPSAVSEATPVVETPVVAAEPTIAAKLYPEGEKPVVEAETEAVEGEEKPAVEAEAKVEPEAKTEVEGEVKPLTAESYTFTYPEGFTPDDKSIADVKAIFAETGVPVDKAQALMDLYSTNLKAASESAATAAQAQFTELNNTWVSEINAMPEFQGETAKETRTILGRAMDEYGSPEAREAFTLTGAGNNPAIVKYILGLAKAVTEGSMTPMGKPPAKPTATTLGGRLYPDKPN